MQIRIYLDGTFESVSAAAPKSLRDYKDRVTALTKDLKIAKAIAKHRKAMDSAQKRIAALKHTPASPAKAGRVEAQRNIVADSKHHIAALKKTLSSTRHTDPAEVQTLLSSAKVALRAKNTEVTKNNKERFAEERQMFKNLDPKHAIKVLEKHVRGVEQQEYKGNGNEFDNLERIRSANRDINLLKAGKQPKLIWTRHLFDKTKK